ncbi:MAG: adenylate/guanylate cyclase domain-containing protein [Rhizobacter sp.]
MSDNPNILPDLSQLSMTEIIRYQGLLQQELTRRFERQLALVFSDIVGSTPYFARFGDAAGRQLQQLHYDLLTQGLEAQGGRVVDTAGDGAFIVFDSAAAAVQGVVAVQRAVSQANLGRSRPHQLQLRMGLHWGSVLTDGKAVSGDSVNLCARVASSSEVGEIRLTRELFHELGSATRVLCQPLGHGELKGVARAVEVLRLEWRDRSQFPTQLRLEPSGEIVNLPAQDIISFGRLREYEGAPANDVVLIHPDPQMARHISRWHFEFRRGPQGYCLRSLSDSATEINDFPAAKGQDMPVGPGTRIRVAAALTLVLIPPAVGANSDGDRTMIDMAKPSV